ncbi:MAG: inositol monophosphatase family protein [Pirellulales bacterium]
MSIPVPIQLSQSSSSVSLQTAARAACAGAEVILRYYREGTQIRSKSTDATYNLVTDADLESEKAVVNAIRQAFPTHEIVGEEQAVGNIDAADVWIVDPLDGTNNFAHRIPQFSVSVAYYQSGKAVCGVVVNPVSQDWYWADAGQGAFHNGRRLRVSQESSLSGTMVGLGFYYDRGAMMEATLAAIRDFFHQNIHGVRRFGSAALDLCYVADGMFGTFFEYNLSPWDFAAGRLILEEAGGKITDGRGEELPLRSTSVLATNGLLHPASLKIVSEHHL